MELPVTCGAKTNLLGEAQVQETIGFVQTHHLHVVQIYRQRVVHVIDHTARSANHDVGTTLQIHRLALQRQTAHDECARDLRVLKVRKRCLPTFANFSAIEYTWDASSRVGVTITTRIRLFDVFL